MNEIFRDIEGVFAVVGIVAVAVMVMAAWVVLHERRCGR